MLKFFRRIRKDLINNGNTSKYLKYAIGEIVLVVIGILIALQINNWNENKKLRIEEKKLLNKIRTEFETNQSKIVYVIAEQRLLTQRLRYLLNHTGPEPKSINKDSLINCLGAMFYIPKYVPNQGILGSALSSGKISLITNDTLNTKLIQWPGKISDYEYVQKILYDITKNQIMEAAADVFPIRNGLIDIGHGNTGISQFSIDSDAILKSRELETFAELKRIDSESSYQILNELNDTQEEILKLINVELRND